MKAKPIENNTWSKCGFLYIVRYKVRSSSTPTAADTRNASGKQTKKGTPWRCISAESGVAVSFVDDATLPHFRLIEKRHQLEVPREQLAGFEPTESPPPPAAGGIKGRRKSKKDKLREAAARTGKPE